MPNSKRQELIREVERSIENLNWVGTHLTRVFQTYEEASSYYSSNDIPLPPEYNLTFELLTNILDGVITMQETLQAFVETM